MTLEQNYIYNSYIQKCDIISSLSYIFLGVYGLNMYNKLKWYRKINYVSLIFIGIGGVIFHSTLNMFCQILDELSITSSIYVFWITINPINIIPYILWILNVILYFYNFYNLFVLTVILSTGFLIYYSYNIYTKYRYLHLKKIYNYLIYGPILISLSFVFFWLPEHVFCAEDRCYYIHKTPLHALWHIFSSIGIFLCMIASTEFNRIWNRNKLYNKFRVIPL